MGERIRQRISPEDSLPAGGQGAVGIELRSDDADTLALLQALHHRDTALRVIAERAMNQRLQGGCQVPIACYALLDDEAGELWLRGLVGRPDGSTILRAEGRAAADENAAEELGVSVAEQLLAQGAADILAEVYG